MWSITALYFCKAPPKPLIPTLNSFCHCKAVTEWALTYIELLKIWKAHKSAFRWQCQSCRSSVFCLLTIQLAKELKRSLNIVHTRPVRPCEGFKLESNSMSALRKIGRLEAQICALKRLAFSASGNYPQICDAEWLTSVARQLYTVFMYSAH